MLQWQQNSLVFMNGILNEEAVNMYKGLKMELS